MQSSHPNFKRFPAIKMTVPQMKGGITQGAAPTSFQLAIQKKQNEAKVAVGAGILATAMSFFNPAPAMAAAADNVASGKTFESTKYKLFKNEKTPQKEA